MPTISHKQLIAFEELIKFRNYVYRYIENDDYDALLETSYSDEWEIIEDFISKIDCIGTFSKDKGRRREMTKSLEEVIEDNYYCDYDEKLIPGIAKAIRTYILEQLKEKDVEFNSEVGDSISKDDSFWDDQSQYSCLNLGYNKCRSDLTKILGKD